MEGGKVGELFGGREKQTLSAGPPKYREGKCESWS